MNKHVEISEVTSRFGLKAMATVSLKNEKFYGFLYVLYGNIECLICLSIDGDLFGDKELIIEYLTRMQRI